MKQSARDKAISSFREASSGVLVCTDVAARGLDIPDVHCVIQYDLPQKEETFIHRVGRTARMERQGRAIVFIMPKEEAFVEYIKKGAPLKEGKCSENVSDVIPDIRSLAQKDRLVMEKGRYAFLSFVRAYKEHELSYILRLKDLDIGKLAMDYGLLCIPTMAEITLGKLSTKGFTPVEGVKLEDIKFKDNAREKQRQKNLIAIREKQQEEKKERVKRSRKAVDATNSKEDLRKRRKLTGKQRQTIQTAEDDEEMARDYRLLKKLKKGKVTLAEDDI